MRGTNISAKITILPFLSLQFVLRTFHLHISLRTAELTTNVWVKDK